MDATGSRKGEAACLVEESFVNMNIRFGSRQRIKNFWVGDAGMEIPCRGMAIV